MDVLFSGMLHTIGESMLAGFLTHSGRTVDLLAFLPIDVDIEDIAHALSREPRYGGHLDAHYSVAQHSVLVSMCAADEDELWGLLHDASEAYIKDIPKPLKQSVVFEPYRRLERHITKCVCRRYGLSDEEPASVKVADRVVAEWEERDLRGIDRPDCRVKGALVPWDADTAKAVFLKRFRNLYRGHVRHSRRTPNA
jgi:hypothetical protein